MVYPSDLDQDDFLTDARVVLLQLDGSRFGYVAKLMRSYPCRPGSTRTKGASMIIRNLAIATRVDTRVTFANIVWEDQPYPEQVLTFEVLCRDILSDEDDARQREVPCAD